MQRLSTVAQRISRLFRSRDEQTESVQAVIERLDVRDAELDRQIAILRATTRAQTFQPHQSRQANQNPGAQRS